MRIISIILILVLAGMTVSAQKLKDKIAQYTKGDKTEQVYESQDVIAGRWERDGVYGSWVENGGLFEPSSKKQLRIYKDTNGLAYKVKFDGREYPLWNPGGSDWASGFSHNDMHCMCFFENTIIYYSMDYKAEKVNAVKWQIGKRLGGKNKVIKLVQDYLDYGTEKIQADREAIAQAEKENRAKYSLKDKEVVAIKPVWLDGVAPDKMFSGEEKEIGFEITLADGSVMKTMNLGGEAYIEDLEIVTHQNVSYSGGFGQSYSTGLYGGYGRDKQPTIKAVSPATMDASVDLILEVKSKYEGSASARIEFPVYFGNKGWDGFYTTSFNGCAGTSQDGKDGHEGREVFVQLKQVKHAVTKQVLHIYKCNDNVHIISAGGSMTVQAVGGEGQCGGDGDDRHENESGAPGDGGDGGDGGRGGDITLLIDPSVTISPDFKPIVTGGTRGSAGLHGICWSDCPAGANGEDGNYGSNGADGTFTEKKGKVNF